MTYLTYAEREMLLQNFRSLQNNCEVSDDELLAEIHNWVKSLEPKFGFELSLTRDITALSHYLVNHSNNNDLADIARGGLLYVLRSKRAESKKRKEFGLFDDAFITSYAIHEIRARLGEAASYNPPRLAPNERKRAENMFLAFTDQPVMNDNDLIAKSKALGNELGGLALCGLFRRLQNNIDFLISILNDPKQNAEKTTYARAGLSYLVCEEDVIDDRLGLVGYIDDNFILQLAVDLIAPDREPWLDLIDATVGEWPFLNWMIIDDGSGCRPISEFMIINSALSCPKLRRNALINTTSLIAPLIGPAPFLLGFVAVLGMIKEAMQNKLTHDSFSPGQKVLVDHCAVAEYTGIKEIAGRKFFGLKQHHTRRGESQPCINYWPLADLRRLLPVDEFRATRGSLRYNFKHCDILIPGLEYLFNVSRSIKLTGIEKHILTVMPITTAFNYAKNFQIFGHNFTDVVPMGHLTSEGEVRQWTTRFGQIEPLLIFVSDLDLACCYAEDHLKKNHLIVLDASGRNSNKTASLKRIQKFTIPLMVISEERTVDDVIIPEEDRSDIWEWKKDDFSALLWPHSVQTANHPGPMRLYDRQLASQASACIELKTIPFHLAEHTFEMIRKLGALGRQRGDDRLIELDELITSAYLLFSYLIRFPLPLCEGSAIEGKITDGIDRIKLIKNKSLYLTDTEQQVGSKTVDLLEQLFLSLKNENPKSKSLNGLLEKNDVSAIICPDARIIPDLEQFFINKKIDVLASYSNENIDFGGAVVPGWFRKERMKRLLIPPITSPLILMLYEIEQNWYQSFRSVHQKNRELRSTKSNRAKLFPGIQGWQNNAADVPNIRKPNQEDSSIELQSIQQHVRNTYRNHIYRSTKPDGVEPEVSARLIVFEGNDYAFLTDSYKACTITHLLDNATLVEDKHEDIKQKTIEELKPGDALLFHQGSSSDVIKSASDRILEEGVREMSNLWQKALLKYARRENLTYEQVWERLKRGGCPLHYVTIKNWMENENIIAPQAYKRDVRIISEITGDKDLLERMDDVFKAISKVKSAHLKVSRQLVKQVRKRAVKILKEEKNQLRLIEIEPNVVVVRIMDIETQSVSIRSSLANRLLEDELWRE